VLWKAIFWHAVHTSFHGITPEPPNACMSASTRASTVNLLVDRKSSTQNFRHSTPQSRVRPVMEVRDIIQIPVSGSAYTMCHWPKAHYRMLVLTTY
jgi:hypothetical protein